MNGNLCLPGLNQSMQQIRINDSWNNPQECLKNMDCALQHCIDLFEKPGLPNSCGIILGPSAINYTHSMGQGVYGNNVNRLNRSKSLNRCKSPGAGLILTGQRMMTPSFNNPCYPCSMNCGLNSASGGPSCCCSRNGSTYNVGKIVCKPFQQGLSFRSSINANLHNNCPAMPSIDAFHYVNNPCPSGTCLPVKRSITNCNSNCDIDSSSLSRVARCKKKFESNCSNICPQCKKIIPVNTCCSCSTSRPTSPVYCCRGSSQTHLNNCGTQGIQTEVCCEPVKACCNQESVDCQTDSCVFDTNENCVQANIECKPKSFNWSMQTESPKIANTWVAHTMELCDDVEDCNNDEISHMISPRICPDTCRYTSNRIATNSGAGGCGGGGCGYSTGRAELDITEMGLGIDFSRNTCNQSRNPCSNIKHRYYRIRNQEEDEARNRSEETYQNQHLKFTTVTRISSGRKDQECNSRGRRLVNYLDDDAAEIAYGIKNHEHFTEDIEGKEKLYSTKISYNTTAAFNNDLDHLSPRSSSPNPSLFSVDNGCQSCEPVTKYYTQSYYPANYRYRNTDDDGIGETSAYSTNEIHVQNSRKYYDS